MLLLRMCRLLRKGRQLFGDRGVQSPVVYSLVRDVVRNRTPFYAYTDLRPQLCSMGRTDRKEAKLLFRLANYMQAPVAMLPQNRICLAPFVERGCRKTRVVAYTVLSLHPSDPLHSLILIANTDALQQVFTQAEIPDRTAVVVPSIYSCPAVFRQWQTFIADPRVTLSFDLGYLGLAFIHPAFMKQHYAA